MENQNLINIIHRAFEDKAAGVQDAFNNAMQDKLGAAIAARKDEISAEMHGIEDTTDEDV